MKISTKGRYGLKAIVDLAINSRAGENITLKSIAERQNLSERYLEQIFSTLKKNGIVISIKGSQGGYILSRSASDIFVGEVLRALEGELHIVNLEDDVNDKIGDCIKNNVWNKINENIDKIVDSITLEDLVLDYDRLISNGYMYFI